MTPLANLFTADPITNTIFWIDPQGRILDASDGACRALGYDREALLTLSVWDVDPDFPRDRWPDHWRELRQAKTLHFRTTHRRHNGSLVPVEVTAYHVELAGQQYNCALVREIDPQRQTETALRESEERLALALAVSGQGLYDLDITTGQTVFSNEYARMLGYGPSELVLTPEVWASWLHLEEREEILHLFEDCVTGKRRDYRAEFRLRTRSGDWIWVLSVGKIVQWDATGRPVRMIGTHLDITEQRRAEEALRLTQIAVDRVSVGVFWFDAEGTLVYVNEQACRSLGYSRDEMIGAAIEKFDTDFPKGQRVELWQRLRTAGSLTFESWHRRKDGSRFPVEVASNYIAADGKEYNFAFARDITDRKAAETRLRYHLELEQALAEISALMIKPGWDDFDARVDWTLERIGRLTEADRSYLFAITSDGSTATNTHEWCAHGIHPQIRDAQNLPLADYQPFYDGLRGGEVVSVQTAALPDDTALRAILRAGDVRSLLCVPMSWGGKLQGFIGFDAVVTERTWSEESIRLLRMVAETVAHTLQHIESDRTLRENAHFLENLDRISRILARPERDADLLAELATAILEIFQADRSFFLHPGDPDAARFHIRIEATRPEWPGVFASGAKITRDGVAIVPDDAFRNDLRRTLRRDGPTLSDFAGAPDASRLARHAGIRSQMTITLRPQLGPPWVLGVHQCAHDRRWTDPEQQLFRAIAERVSDALSGHLLLQHLQESEQRYRTVFENAHDAIIVHDFQGGIQAVNQTMLTLFGLEHEEALRTTIADLSGPDNLASPANDHWLRVARGEILHFEWNARRPNDGSCFPVEVMLRAIRFGGENCILSNVRDITERKRAEEELQLHREHLEELVAERTAELRQAMTQLVQSEKLAALGHLVAGVAHELNTPLGNTRVVASSLGEEVRAFAAAVESGALRRSQADAFLNRSREAVDLLERNAARAADLIGHFKQVAVDQTSMRRRRFSLRQTVEELLATLRPQFKHTAHRIELDIPPDIELDSYPGPLEQVVANLVGNSLTHGFAGIEAGVIRIRAALLDADRVQLDYTDDGIGIPEPILHRIFEPFFTTRLGQGGSGLGLYIVYNLITGVLGGTVQAERAPERGATFTVILPRIEARG